MRYILSALVLLSLASQAQIDQSNAAEIKLRLNKLNFLGSVLYVAAHPDDENTRVIAYFANERLAATARAVEAGQKIDKLTDAFALK